MTAEITKSVLPWRVMTLWQQIDGDVLFTHEPTVLRSEEMREPTPESRLGEFIELIAGIGINALDLRYYSEAQRPLLIPFARYLRNHGIRLLIGHQWTELETGRRCVEDDITRNLRSLSEEIRLDLHQPWIEEYFKANPLVSGILPEPVDD